MSPLPAALLGALYEDKDRQDFIFTIYHWWQAVAIFVVYLGMSLPMKVRLCGAGVSCPTALRGSAPQLWGVVCADPGQCYGKEAERGCSSRHAMCP